MKIVLKYHQRAGDVFRLLPIAKHLHKQGHEIFIECFEEYKTILDLVSYAKWKDPKSPYASMAGGEKKEDKKEFKKHFDWLYDLEIWPNHITAYRASKMTWWNFVISLAKREWCGRFTTPVDPTIVLDKTLPSIAQQLPEKFALVAATGYSQLTRVNQKHLYDFVNSKIPDGMPVIYLVPPGVQPPFQDALALTTDNHAQLVTVVAKATELFTINTSVSIIAGSTLNGKPLRSTKWYHVSEPFNDFQDDHICPPGSGQTRILFDNDGKAKEL